MKQQVRTKRGQIYNNGVNDGYDKLPASTVSTQGANHGRVDSNTGLLNKNGYDPDQRDNWLDSELLNNNQMNGNQQNLNQLGSSFTGNPKVDMNTSQLQIKSGKDQSMQPNSNGQMMFQKQPTRGKGLENSSRNKNKIMPLNSLVPDEEYEQQMENIISEYNHNGHQQPQSNASDTLIPQRSNNSNVFINNSKQQNSGRINAQSVMNGSGTRNQQMNGVQTVNPATGQMTKQQSNYDVTNPILENIEQSFAQSRSNIASMIQQYGQDADPLPDVEDILEEEDNIKEASQFRSRDIIMRQRSGHQQSKYRTMTTMIRDPDADLLENETEAQIMKIKRFCRKMCRCCKKKETLDDSFNYTSGDSDLDCQEMFLAMDDDEQSNRVVELWQRTLAKARGAVKVIEIFGDLNRRIYLYGSDKKHDYLYEQDKLKPLPFILFPQDRLKNVWNMVMMLVVIYTGTYIPYKTAFIEDSTDLVNNIELAIDSLFIIDVVVNFISAYEDNEKNVEFRLSKIAYSYIMSWFLFDVVSCIPFQYLDFSSGSENGDFVQSYDDELVPDDSGTSTEVYNSFGGATLRFLATNTTTGVPGKTNNSLKYSKLLKLTRLPRLYKLLRILRLFKMMRLLKYNRNIKKLFDQLKLNPGYMKMITVSVTVLFLVHLVSCFYFMVASFTDFDPDSWVVQKKLQDDTNFAQYITAMYWAFQTLTTVGYGDVQGSTTLERVYCLLWMIFGVAFYSFTIGNLQSIISTIDVKASELSAKLNTLTGFAKRTKLPDNIVLKIKRFLENNNANNIVLSDSRQMLNELPSTLRAEVVKQTYADIIEKVKFFNKKDSDFLWAFLPALKPMKVYSKDILYSQGDHPEEVFFIQKGRVKLCYDVNEGESPVQVNIPFNMYVEGSYFGDLEILIKRYRKLGRDGTAIVDSECHLLVIGAKELKSILKYFKEIETQMIHTAQKRRRHHQKQIQEAKKRYMEKKVKALKNASLFQNKNALNQFSNWKKRSKKNADNFISRAKASRKKLEMIASHKNGVVQSDDESHRIDQQKDNSQLLQPNDLAMDAPDIMEQRRTSQLQPQNPQTAGGVNKNQKHKNLNKLESVSDYDDSGNDEDEEEYDSDYEEKKKEREQKEKEAASILIQNDDQSNNLSNVSQNQIQQQISSNLQRNSLKSGSQNQQNLNDKNQLKFNLNININGVQNSNSQEASLQNAQNQKSESDGTAYKKYSMQEPVTMLDLNNIQSEPQGSQNFKMPLSSRNSVPQNQPQQNIAKSTIQPQSRQEKPPKAQPVGNRQESRSKSKNEKERQKLDKKHKDKSKKKKKNSDVSSGSGQNGFKHLRNEQFNYDKLENEGISSQYDHEKQMRLFNDTMSALALNAYEIKEVNDKIGEQLQFRNQRLDKMEGMSKNIEGSLSRMESMISKIMESI